MKSTGFSLLELIISLFLITLILGLLYGVINMASNITKEGESVGTYEDHLRVFFSLIDKDLVCTDPKKVFKGTKDSITFYTTHLAKYSTRKVSYTIKNGDITYTFSEDLFDNEKFEVLVKGVKGLEFSYLKDREDDKWTDTWDSEKEKRFPYMVKIVFKEKKLEIMVPLFSTWKAPSFKEENEEK